jgi:hypothetical protein
MAVKGTRTRPAKSAAASDAKAARIEEIRRGLADGIQELADDGAWRRYLDLQASLPRYSFANTMLIMFQCPEASMVMPYGKPGKAGTWMNIGRHARPGEKALYIRKPSFRKTEAGDSPDGKEHTSISFIWVPVFDVSQTDGDPLPEGNGSLCRLLEGDDADGLRDQVAALIRSHGFTFELVSEIEGSEANGDCNYDLKRVRVCTSGRSALQQAKTAVHEAAHMLLHSGSALERGHKELEAESVAYVVLKYLGLDSGDYSFGYVLGWAGYSSAKARDLIISQSGARIQEAVKAVLEGTGAIEARDYGQAADSEAAAA